MSSEPNDNRSCPYCVSPEALKQFLNARQANQIFWCISLIGGLCILGILWGGLHHAHLGWWLALTSGLIPIIPFIVKGRAPSRALFLFRDTTGRIHCERAYPASISPGRTRENSTLAHSPVLRIASAPFASGRFVTPEGKRDAAHRVWIHDWSMYDSTRIYGCKMKRLSVSGLTFEALLALVERGYLPLESLVEDARAYAQAQERITALLADQRDHLETLSSERAAHALERGSFLDDLAHAVLERDDAFTALATLTRVHEELLQTHDTLAIEVIETLARIRHFHARRCPREIPTKLERALDAVLSPEHIVRLIDDLASTAHPDIGHLRETPFYRERVTANLPPDSSASTPAAAHPETTQTPA